MAKYFYFEKNVFSTLHDTHKFRCAYFLPSISKACKNAWEIKAEKLLFICPFTSFFSLFLFISFSSLLKTSSEQTKSKRIMWRRVERYIFIMLAEDKKMHFLDWHYSFANKIHAQVHISLLFWRRLKSKSYTRKLGFLLITCSDAWTIYIKAWNDFQRFST